MLISLQILIKTISCILNLPQQLLPVILPLYPHLLFSILGVNIIRDCPVLLLYLEERVLGREPAVVVPPNALFDELLESVVGFFGLLLEMENEVDVVEDIVGLCEVLVEPLELELELVSLHPTDEASGCLILLDCALLFSDL